MDTDKLFEQLKALAGENIIGYNNKLIPNAAPCIGVKLPELRKLAKQYAKEDYITFMGECPDTYYEYEILKAYVIGYAKDDIDNILKCASEFVPKIHDWAVNDGFCSTFKIAAKHPQKVWDWMMQYTDGGEYEQRMVAVMCMSYYLNNEYIDRVLDLMDKLKYDGYYTRMGVAWCVATAMAKQRDRTFTYMQNNKLEDWTYNKSIQKMLESYRISNEDKILLRQMKR